MLIFDPSDKVKFCMDSSSNRSKMGASFLLIGTGWRAPFSYNWAKKSEKSSKKMAKNIEGNIKKNLGLFQTHYLFVSSI